MKDSEIKELDEDDHVFIETLKTLGMSRNVATTIAYLMKVNEASAQEIELSTGLRHPEISLAMKLICNPFASLVLSATIIQFLSPHMVKIWRTRLSISSLLLYLESRPIAKYFLESARINIFELVPMGSPISPKVIFLGSLSCTNNFP